MSEESVPQFDEVPVGARVQVTSLDHEDLGLGTYQGDVPLAEAIAQSPEVPQTGDENQETASAIGELVDLLHERTTSKIKLDSEKIVFGFQCYWTRVDD